MKNFTFIIATVIVVLIFGLIVRAQNSDDEIPAQEKREITKFARSFLRSFIEKSDIDKMPATLFEKDFKARFIKYSEYISTTVQNEEIPEQIKYQAEITFHNFSNLLLIVGAINSKYPVETNEKDSECDNDPDLAKILPPYIVEKFKKTKWLRFVVEDNDSEDSSDPKTLIELNEFIKEMSMISDQMRLYLRNHPAEKSANFSKLQDFEYYPAKICEADGCMGLPERTPIFAVHVLGMCLRIVKIRGQWKVVQIYSIAAET